jgi:hypothetical protein
MVFWYLDYLLSVNLQNQRLLLELNRKEIVDSMLLALAIFEQSIPTIYYLENKKIKNSKKLVQQHLKQSQALAATYVIPHYSLAANGCLAKGMLKVRNSHLSANPLISSVVFRRVTKIRIFSTQRVPVW